MNANLIEKLTMSIADFEISNHSFGSAYYVLATPDHVVSSIFDNDNQIRFINCPFKEAIKVPFYIQEKGKKFGDQIIDEIQALITFKIKTGSEEHFTNLIVVLFSELKVHDIVFLETTGLSELSIIKLMRFCDEILRNYHHKKLFVVDVSNIQPNPESDITVYKIDERLINEIVMRGLNNFTGRHALHIPPGNSIK